MACERNQGCNCPSTSCVRHGKCCECVKAHRDNDDLTYCMKRNDDGSNRLEGLYKKLHAVFGENK